MKHNITVDWDQLLPIILVELARDRQYLQDDLNLYKQGKNACCFTTDPKEDKKLLKKHIKAYDLLIAFYT